MIDWRELDKVTIFNGKDENGNRYLSQFLKQYRETFGVHEINAGCERCLNDYYTKFIKYLNTMSNEKQECKFKLKKKYEGIQKEFGSREFVTNANLTDETAMFLLENHARGKELFSEIPKELPNISSKEVKDENMKLKDLKEKYPLVKPSNKKAVFLERIAEWKATQDSEEVNNTEEEE